MRSISMSTITYGAVFTFLCFTSLLYAQDQTIDQPKTLKDTLIQKILKTKANSNKSSAKNKSDTGAKDTGAKDTGAKDTGAKEENTQTPHPYIPKKPRALIKQTQLGKALLIPIKGTIDLGLPPFINRSLKENPQADIIILEVNTFGGRVDAAVQIRDRLLEEQRPCIAWVHRRAISAGALISLAADYIVFSEGSSMGAATPIQVQSGKAQAVGEKMVSYFRSEMRATAEANGWDGDLAEAMVDADRVVGTVSPKGKLLTVSTQQAEKLGLTNARINTLSDLLQEINVSSEVIKVETNWAEQVARAVTDPTLSGLLMSVGMLGIMVELYSPGIGFAGILGFLSLLTFFLGHKIVGLAGIEELVILIMGVILLAVEVFVIPGFGIAGILGLLMIATGMVTSMNELPDTVSWDLQVFDAALQTFLYAFLTSIFLMTLAIRYLPRSQLFSWLVLDQDLSNAVIHQYQEKGSHEIEESKKAVSLTQHKRDIHVGTLGKTTTPLRLSGKGRFGEKVFDIVSRDEYLESNTQIKVVSLDGNRVVVVRDESDQV